MLQGSAGWLTETPHTPPYTQRHKDVLPPLKLGRRRSHPDSMWVLLMNATVFYTLVCITQQIGS